MKGQISQYILVIGILVIVAITVFTSSTFLGEVDLPEDRQQNLTGDDEQTMRQLADLSERCWNQGRQGSNPRYIDCFRVDIDIDGSITQEEIRQRLETLPEDNFQLQGGSLGPGKYTLKISYLPNNRTIQIRPF